MSLKILLADDSLTAQNMGKKILSDAGYEVVAVSNGAAAMKKISATQFDVLLLDVVMPGYTGPEVCAKTRDLKPYAKTPILFTIGKMELGEFKVEDAPRLKADGVVIKPFEASDLIAAVQKLTAISSPATAARTVPTVPPEAEKTAKIAPITEETDDSFAAWSATAEKHREEGDEPEAPAAAHAPVEMPVEAAAAAAFDEVAAAPAFEAPAVPAPAFEASSVPASFDLGAAPAYDPLAAEAPVADAGSGTLQMPVPSFEASALETPIPLEPPTLESPIPLESAVPPSLPSFAHELETTPEPVQLGHVEKAPGFEATAADPTHAHVETAPELEIPSIHDHTPVAPDPNFQSDRTTMVEEFATKFSAAGPEIAVGIAAPEVVEHEGPVPVHHEDETARISPWVSEPAPEHPAADHHVDFTPPPSPGLHLGLEEFAAEIATAPVAAPEPEHVVELAPPPAEVVEVAEPAPSMAAELEQAIITADAQEEPAPVAEAAAPATLEASLEQSLAPEAIVEPTPEPAVEEPKKAGDLEFAQALEAAISTAPEAPPEPQHAAAAAAAAGTSASIAEETGKFAAMPELDGVDPKIIATAIERVLANAKSQIMEEVLKELKK